MYGYQFLTGLHLITGILVPFFTKEGGMNFSWVMGLQAWFWFWQCALEVPTGIIADIWGRKRSIVAGSIMFLLGIASYVGIPLVFMFFDFFGSHLLSFLARKFSWLMFFLGSFFWALGLALVSGADESLLYDSVVADGREHESKKIINTFNGLHRLGWAIGAPLAGGIGYLFGLKEVIYCMTIPFFLALLIALTLKEPPRKRAAYKETLKNAWTTIRDTRALHGIVANDVLISGALISSLWLHQQLLQTLSVPIIWYGWVQTGFMGVASLILLSGFVAAFEKITGSRREYLTMSALVSASGIALLGFVASQKLAIILAIAVLGFGLARSSPLMNYFNKYIDSRERATAASLRNALQSFATAALNLMVSIIAAWSLTSSFLFLGAAIGVVAFCFPLKEKELID